MRIFKCNKCGCVIPETKLLEKIENLKAENFIQKKTEREAKKEIRKKYPYLRCHNPDCDGLLREIENNSVGTKFKDRKDG